MNLLDTRPKRNCRWRRLEDGSVVLEIIRFKTPFSRALGHFFDLKPRRRLHLDERGTASWTLFDGKRTVEDIGKVLSSRFPDDDQIYGRMSEFIAILETNGLVILERDHEFGDGKGRVVGPKRARRPKKKANR